MQCKPIGLIHTPFSRLEDMPIQPAGAADVTGTIEVYEEFQTGLKDLDGFSHIILLYHFHHSHSYSLSVEPFLDTQARGLFATRAPRRPNPIGISVVQLNGIMGNVLNICKVDILDCTPLLDIKPYVPEFDSQVNVRTGWLENTVKNVTNIKSDGRFR